MYEIISKSPVFRGLKVDEIKELFKKTEFFIKSYKKDEVIAFRNQENEYLMIMIEGTVSGEMQDFNGKVIKIEEMEPPKPLAPAFLFGSQNVIPVDIIAAKDSKILFLPRKSVLFLMQNNTVILKNYLDMVCNKAKFLSDKLWFVSFKTIKEKLSHYILNLDPQKRNVITLQNSQTELAVYFGVARPSLARVITELVNDGIIEVNGREIKIVDRQGLINFIEE